MPASLRVPCPDRGKTAGLTISFSDENNRREWTPTRMEAGLDEALRVLAHPARRGILLLAW